MALDNVEVCQVLARFLGLLAFSGFLILRGDLKEPRRSPGSLSDTPTCRCCSRTLEPIRLAVVVTLSQILTSGPTPLLCLAHLLTHILEIGGEPRYFTPMSTV